MRIGVIINILIIFLIIFYTLFAGMMEYFIKWRIKLMIMRYSWKGNPRPPTNYHVDNPNSMLRHEVKAERHSSNVPTEEYIDLMDYRVDLPLIQTENTYINSKAKVKYEPT